MTSAFTALALSVTVSANPPDPLEVARELQEEHRYEEASAVLEAAHKKNADPLFLVGRAEIERRGLSCATAIELFGQYLATPAKTPDEKAIQNSAKDMVPRCRQAIALEQEADEDAQAGLLTEAADKYAQAFEITGSRALYRKRIRVATKLSDCERAATLLGELGQRRPIDDAWVELQSTVDSCGQAPSPVMSSDSPQPPPPDPRPPRRDVDGVGIGFVVGGGVFMAGGAGLIGGALQLRTEAQAEGAGLELFRSNQTRARGFQGVGTACLVVGTAAVIGGVIHIVRHRRRRGS